MSNSPMSAILPPSGSPPSPDKKKGCEEKCKDKNWDKSCCKMAPPIYTDLGKSSRDTFNKGYNYGFLKLETTSKTGSGLEFKSVASQNSATNKLFGSFDIKYKIPQYGVILTEKWNTDNTLNSEISIEDQVAKGFKLTFDSSFSPNIGKRSGKIKGDFQHTNLRVTSDVSLDWGGPLVNAAAVGLYEGWLVGAQVGYDSTTSKLTNTNFAVGRQESNYTIHSFINNQNEFGGSVHHKVNPNLELAGQMSWKTGDNVTGFGLAAKYALDRDTTVRAKVDRQSTLALALTHALRPELKLTVSALTNMADFNGGGHKFGIGLEYES